MSKCDCRHRWRLIYLRLLIYLGKTEINPCMAMYILQCYESPWPLQAEWKHVLPKVTPWMELLVLAMPTNAARRVLCSECHRTQDKMIFCLSLASTGRLPIRGCLYLCAHCTNFTKEAHTRFDLLSEFIFSKVRPNKRILFDFLQRASLVILLCRSWFVSRDL